MFTGFALVVSLPLAILISWPIYHLAPPYSTDAYVVPWLGIVSGSMIVLLIAIVSMQFLSKTLDKGILKGKSYRLG